MLRNDRSLLDLKLVQLQYQNATSTNLIQTCLNPLTHLHTFQFILEAFRKLSHDLKESLLHDVDDASQEKDESEEQKNFVGGLASPVLVEQLSRLLNRPTGV